MRTLDSLTAAGSRAPVERAEPERPADDTPWSGERVIDCHFHERPTDQATIAHLDGSGVSSALVLAFGDFRETYHRLQREQPGRIAGWARGPRLSPAADEAGDPDADAFDLTNGLPVPSRRNVLSTLRIAGWKGFAETTGPVAIDGPELQRAYALAAELDVPIMMHFQEAVVPGQPAYGITGFSRIEAMLKKYPETRFVCHAPDFWGGIDARYRDGGTYFRDEVVRGGLSDRLLADYSNMYGDLGAPSALLQLIRDLDFTAGFLDRHRDKLMFGSDCGCADGRGGMPAGAPRPRATASPAAAAADGAGAEIDAATAAAMQAAMAALGGLAGKCIARELLSVTWKTTSREVFRQIVADNAIRVYGLG